MANFILYVSYYKISTNKIRSEKLSSDTMHIKQLYKTTIMNTYFWRKGLEANNLSGYNHPTNTKKKNVSETDGYYYLNNIIVNKNIIKKK